MSQQLLATVAQLQDRVNGLPSSDEIQAILRGILVVLQLQIEVQPDTIPLQSAFYSHLDTCKQCAAHPFDLCAEGQILIRAAGFEAARWIQKQREERTA
jgi:hypothetical protein